MPDNTAPHSGPLTCSIATPAKAIDAPAKGIDAPAKAVRLLVAQRKLVESALGDRGTLRISSDVFLALLDRAAHLRRPSKEPAQPEPRGQGRLSAEEVRSKREPGRYGDGGGLYLEILPSGRRQWLLRYQMARRRRHDMSLGAVTEENGVSEARTAAARAHALIAKGKDPLDERQRLRNRQRPQAPTFEAAARELIEVRSPSWRGSQTKRRAERCLLVHARRLGPRPVDRVATADVLRVLKPLWSTKPEMAHKTRECIEQVLDAQRAAEAIRGSWENPARWRGHLEHLLPKGRAQVRHHPAMPYEDTPAFVAALRAQDSMGARALEFAVLTACREGVIIAAKWEEMRLDGDAPTWIVPAEKMKQAKALRVPLSPPAVALLMRLRHTEHDEWVFRGQRKRYQRRAPHICATTMDAVFKRMGLPYTPHGFRSTFRDWAGDCTEYPRELIEEALAHAVGDATERAYRRSDALVKRRRLMEGWAEYLGGGRDPPRLGRAR